MIRLISFLVQRSRVTVVVALVLGVLNGVSNVALLALFNIALRGERYSHSTIIWGFVGLCVFVPLTRFASEVILTRLAQNSLFDLEMRLSEQIAAAPLRHLEEIGPHRLLAVLTQDLPVLTGTLVIFPLLCINISVAIAGLVYLGWLSWIVLLATLGFIIIGITLYQIPAARAAHFIGRARGVSDLLYEHFNSLTSGAKELKLHRRRRGAFVSKVEAAALSFRRHNTKGLSLYSAAASWGYVLGFALIGMLLFVLPALKEVSAYTLTGYTITLLYLMPPLQVIMSMISNMAIANIAFEKVEGLSEELSTLSAEPELHAQLQPAPAFTRLDLIEVTHTYRCEGEKNDFKLGPITLSLFPKEVVFLVGGNGSGKTTFAKLLTGLYAPEEGEMRLDGQAITDENRDSYRQHFSAVFSDFHLFDRLLGLANPELDERARDYLVQLQLNQKVEVKDGVLSTTKLSQGQRKRLALLTACLEDRPICVFDEWAADQDPLFKEVFYYRILPEIKAKGKALLVISHDERYYGVADRIFKLDQGKIDFSNAVFDLQPEASENPVFHGTAEYLKTRSRHE
jgi:putative ATP-binding cassette transporter